MSKITTSALEKKYQSANECPIRIFMEHIGGKWKPIILWLLARNEIMRFSELKGRMDGISQKVLSQHLRELEQQGLIGRHSYPTTPPKVEYRLTDKGRSLIPILHEIKIWTEAHLQ